jgi:hypothetical protein
VVQGSSGSPRRRPLPCPASHSRLRYCKIRSILIIVTL